MTTHRDTSQLIGLDQVFELEPRWGSPICEEDEVLVLSNREQTVKVQLSFAESGKMLIGRGEARPTDGLNESTAEDTAETDLTDIRKTLAHLVAVTEEEREHAKSVLSAALPLVDLQPFSADVFGVSRNHAVLERDSQHIVIMDLNSTNGTRLNGTLLIPFQRRIIRNGDALQLGALQLRVRFRKLVLSSDPQLFSDVHV